MSEKPDFYTVLGVARTASEDEIKTAFKKIVMTCHEDMVRNKLKRAGKSEAEIATAVEEAKKTFQLATEAKDVLTDSSRRATYDKYGHQGLQNIKDTGGGGYTESIGERPVKRVPTETELFDFFDKTAEKNSTPSSSSGRPGESSDERRARAAEERRRRREEARGGPVSTPSASEDFDDAAEKISDATTRLKSAGLSLEDLKSIRDKAAELIKEVDQAIARANKNNGPRP